MRLSEIPEDAWKAQASPIPTKIVVDNEALCAALESKGWLLLEPPAIDHRTTKQGAVESKILKDFKNWVINNKGVMLSTRRVGQHRWFVAFGAPCLTSQQRRKLKQRVA